MYYIQCSVKSLLLTQFLLMQVYGTLDHCFIITHSIHSLQIHFSVIFLKKAPRTDPCHIWCTYMLCPFSGCEKNRWQCSWLEDFAEQCLRWRTSSHKRFFAPALGLPTNPGVGRSWLFPAFSIKFLTRRSLKSQCIYLASHEDNSIQLLSTVRSRRWKNNFVVHLKVHQLIK